MEDFTSTLASWVAQTPRDWPDQAIEQAQRGLTDTTACMVAGAGDIAVRRVASGLGPWIHAGQAHAVGMPGSLDAPWAALLNGTAAHALDYDDVLDPAASHVSAVLIAALLALGEEIQSHGDDLLDAYIVGVEVQECLAEAVNMAHYTQGWHTTITLGSPSAAAACARLLQLDPHQTRNALSIATSMSAGFKRQFGTNAKPFHAGLAAKNGVLAARMAAAGLSADDKPFEGERGFMDLMVGGEAQGFSGPLARIAAQAPPAILRPGLWLKRYPCCASTHRAVDALLDIMSRQSLKADDIKQVVTSVSAAAVGNLMYDRPTQEMEARFSMPFCISAAALDGDLTLQTFRQVALHRADIRSWLPKVSMVCDPSQPADMPSTVKSWADVTVQAYNGDSWTHRVVDPKGYPDRPLSEEDLGRKFADCVQGQLPEIRDSWEIWRGMDSHTSLHHLGKMLSQVQFQAAL